MGMLVPAGVPTTVSVMQGGSVVASANAGVDGSFMFFGLTPGAYTLMFHPMFDYND